MRKIIGDITLNIFGGFYAGYLMLMLFNLSWLNPYASIARYYEIEGNMSFFYFTLLGMILVTISMSEAIRLWGRGITKTILSIFLGSNIISALIYTTMYLHQILVHHEEASFFMCAYIIGVDIFGASGLLSYIYYRGYKDAY